MEEFEVKFYEQEHCVIYGHGVWHYLVTLPIGNVHICEHEGAGMALQRKYFESNQKAEQYFQSVCKKLLYGKVL